MIWSHAPDGYRGMSVLVSRQPDGSAAIVWEVIAKPRSLLTVGVDMLRPVSMTEPLGNPHMFAEMRRSFPPGVLSEQIKYAPVNSSWPTMCEESYVVGGSGAIMLAPPMDYVKRHSAYASSVFRLDVSGDDSLEVDLYSVCGDSEPLPLVLDVYVSSFSDAFRPPDYPPICEDMSDVARSRNIAALTVNFVATNGLVAGDRAVFRKRVLCGGEQKTLKLFI